MQIELNIPTSKVEALIELGFIELKPQFELYNDAKLRIIDSLDSMVGLATVVYNEDGVLDEETVRLNKIKD